MRAQPLLFRPYLTLIISLRVLSTNIATLVVRGSVCKFGRVQGTNFRSIIGSWNLKTDLIFIVFVCLFTLSQIPPDSLLINQGCVIRTFCNMREYQDDRVLAVSQKKKPERFCGVPSSGLRTVFQGKDLHESGQSSWHGLELFET